MISVVTPSVLGGLDLGPVVWQSRSVVVIADGSGLIVDTNAAFERHAGRRAIGESVAGLVDEGQRAALETWLRAAGAAWDHRTWGLFPDADGLPHDFLFAACRTGAGILVLIGEALETGDISAALLDVNRTLVVEHRRLDRERGRLDRMVQLDALTGLANRRAFDQRLVYEVERATTGATFAVVMIDIDHFKAVNDRYGHPAGDRVLSWLGERLGTAARRGDFVARYGGEEFIAILPDASTVDAEAWAERLRQSIRADRPPGIPDAVTASLGVAAWSAGELGQTVVDRADRALYVAKESGRDRVAVVERNDEG